MQTVATLPQANILPSSISQAKKTQANVADSTFNQVLTHQIQEAKNAKEPETTTANNSDTTNKTDAIEPKNGENKSSDDSKIPTEASTSGIDIPLATPTELLALVVNIGQITSKSENTNDSLQLDESLHTLPRDGVSKEPLTLLDGKDIRLDSTANSSNVSDKTSQLIDKTVTSTDRQIKPETEFGVAAQKIHETAIPTNTPTITQMVQTPLNLQHASTMQLAEKLTPQVGTQGWDQALGQKIVWMVAGAQQSATLTLNPPDLGPLQIILNISNDQADATFISTQPEVRHALEAALPKLKEMLNEAGIQLGEATVSSNTQNQDGSSQRHSPKTVSNFNENNIDSIATSQSIHTRPIIAGKQLIDTFA